mmetsp:Transcript_35950/g.34971  ORF Transcript_35950/g.34971 Transcript_35950/m.34971 type:complete len:117 (-) Transcript_35950:136-486(-)
MTQCCEDNKCGHFTQCFHSCSHNSDCTTLCCSNNFCTDDDVCEGKKLDGDHCESNYECRSDYCFKGHCRKSTLEIPEWLMALLTILVAFIIFSLIIVYCLFYNEEHRQRRKHDKKK